MWLPVQTVLWDSRAEGAFVVEVGVQVSVAGSYRPPVSRFVPPALPPHTTIRLPVQTALCPVLPSGLSSSLTLSQVSFGAHGNRPAAPCPDSRIDSGAPRATALSSQATAGASSSANRSSAEAHHASHERLAIR